VLLAELAATSAAVAGTSSRSTKVALIATCLRDAAPDEVEVAVAYLSGELLQRRTGVGWASLRDSPPPAAEPSLTVSDVDSAFAGIAAAEGKGAQLLRRRLLDDVLGRATEEEQRFLRGLVAGELRQGALESLVVDAVARAAGLPVDDVRRAVMLRGALGPVAAAALTEGSDGVARFGLQIGRPVQPMLAQTAGSVAAALDRLGTAAVEWKLDGVRVQVHRSGPEVHVFTRTLDDITDRVPELLDIALGLPVDAVVLDGEAIALDGEGRPRPFQVTASRVGSRSDVGTARSSTPLTAFIFDVLHLDGADLLDLGGVERHAALARVVPERFRVPRLVTADVDAAQAFLSDALARGHEGVVVKALDVPYAAGRRGAGWVKVKPVHTLDLVVLAAEWGHGRRRGWLSNLHLGARDPHTGGFVMLGKTFKGLTDEMLRWQTERLRQLEVSTDGWQVTVRPELVVEVAFDGVQTSPRYPGGMALRFARVVRYREDKGPADADTVDSVRAVHEGRVG
jgi:DNA ligase-1